MSIQITTLSENTAGRVNLLANSIMPAHASISRGHLLFWALSFLSLRAKHGNLLSLTEIASAD